MGWAVSEKVLGHLPFGRHDGSPKVATVDIVRSLPHPHLLHVASSDSLLQRFPVRRAKYIESWNEHVLSAEREYYYQAWQSAEETHHKSLSKQPKASSIRRKEADDRWADMVACDRDWAIIQPTNHYRVAFYVYDHLKGQPQEKDKLFREFANRRTKKQQATLQEVERIYTELTRPLSWEEQDQIEKRSREQRRAQVDAILAEHAADFAQLLATSEDDPKTVFVEKLEPHPIVDESVRSVIADAAGAVLQIQDQPNFDYDITTGNVIAGIVAQRREEGESTKGGPEELSAQYDQIRRELIAASGQYWREFNRGVPHAELAPLISQRNTLGIDLLELRASGGAPGVETHISLFPGERLHLASSNFTIIKFPHPDRLGTIYFVRTTLRHLGADPRIASSPEALLGLMEPFSADESPETEIAFAARTCHELRALRAKTSRSGELQEVNRLKAVVADLLINRIIPLVRDQKSAGQGSIELKLIKNPEYPLQIPEIGIRVRSDVRRDDVDVIFSINKLPRSSLRDIPALIYPEQEFARDLVEHHLLWLNKSIEVLTAALSGMEGSDNDNQREKKNLRSVYWQKEVWMLIALEMRKRGDVNIRVVLDALSEQGDDASAGADQDRKLAVIFLDPATGETSSVSFSHTRALQKLYTAGDFWADLIVAPDPDEENIY